MYPIFKLRIIPLCCLVPQERERKSLSSSVSSSLNELRPLKVLAVCCSLLL